MQIEVYGAVGVCCQKLDEVQSMLDFGVKDVLLTNEIVGEKKISRLCELGRAGYSSIISIICLYSLII